MLSRCREGFAVALIVGMGLAAPLAAQTVFSDGVVLGQPTPSLFFTDSLEGKAHSKWTIDGSFGRLSVAYSVKVDGNPNPPALHKPFVIDGSASDSLLVLFPGGIGSGTLTPQASFHLVRNDGSAQMRIEETGGRLVTPRNLLRLLNTGPVTIRLDDKTTGQAWSLGSNLGGGFFVGATNGLAAGLLLSPSGDLTIGGTLTQGSDRNAKQAIEPVDGSALLERVAELPIATWEYKDAAGVRHLGPMAQDFVAAFGLGADDKHIAPGDAAGVSLAAIQALKSENDALRARLAVLENQVAALVAR